MASSAAAALVRSVRLEEGFAPAQDGTPLFFRSEGDGPPLVFCNGVGVSTFFWHHLVDAFGGPYRAVVWDYKSHGRSGLAPRQGFTIRSCAEDLFRVLDALGLKDAVLVGHSMGTQVCLEAYRMHPERVRGLVLAFGGYGRTVESFFGTRLSLQALQAMKKVALARPDVSSLALRTFSDLPIALTFAKALGIVHPKLCTKAEMRAYFEHLGKLDIGAYFQLAQDLQDHDASDVLAKIAVPTLVFAGDKDKFTPLSLSQHMARTIPGAELCLVRGGSHAALVEQPQLIGLRLERFLVERLGLPKAARLPG